MLCINADIDNIHFTDDELYVLKKTWDNLAEKNSGFGISKEVFIQYVQLNGLLQELLYNQFNIKKLSWIDYDDFMHTMNILCFGSNLEHAKFLFEMCDIDNDGKIQKTLLSVLLHSIPYDLICETQESVDQYIDSIFLDQDSIKCEDFKNWATTVPKIMSYIKDHIPYNIENNLKRRQSVDKLDILPKSTENLEHESWLWKKCKRLGLLKKQYYYLHGSCLYYYNARYDVKPQGIIYLVGSLIKPLGLVIRGMHSFEITQLDLCSGEHNVHESRILYCDTKDNRDEWVKKLQDASQMHLFEDKYYLYTGLKLGSGAYSNVYKCTTQDNFDTQYAVKIIDKTKFGSLEKEHFRAEINILKMIEHPNIIKTYDIYETTQTISIVTELIDDGDLFNYILGKPCFKDHKTRPLIKQLFSCAVYLHDQGIIHSDIKPENILYNKSSGQIKLIDFGLSKILLPNKKTEVVDGTLSYVAPEALQLNMYCAESDVWSIGIVMYLLTYEKLPFDPLPSEEVDGDVNNIIIFNISTKEPIFNYETKSELANNLLKKLLEKSPRKRLSAKHALQDPFFNTLYNTCLLSK
jgi:tRNA A-37 threonylcarbamoyl transferase component Bud32/Ca2+-binding EF-hand superfamily protein